MYEDGPIFILKERWKMLKDKRFNLRGFLRKYQEPHTSHIAHNLWSHIKIKEDGPHA